MALIVIASTVLFLAVMGAISIYGYRRYVKPRPFFERLAKEEMEHAKPLLDFPEEPQEKPLVNAVEQLGEKLPVAEMDASTAKKYLIAAGFRSPNAVKIFYGLKLITAAVFLLLVIVAQNFLNIPPILRIFMVIGGGGAGYSILGILLEHRVNARQEEIRLSLPDALDLMVVCVEAGLGLDQAILNVSRELKTTHKAISEELSLLNLEMRAGVRRADALRNMADRTREEEIRKLVAVLIQTDMFGTSISDSLRTHSDFMRVRRRQEAEERAAKVGVKLVFPIFFFVMPSMMVVAAGPGLLQIFKYLFPMMQQVH